MNIIDLWKYPIDEVNKTLKNKGKTNIDKYIMLTELFAEKQLLTDEMNNFVLFGNFRQDLTSKNMNLNYDERLILIKNYTKNKVSNLKKLSGVRSFIYYNINDCKLLLLGENHMFPKVSSYYIVDYLLDLILTSTENINLFIERPLESYDDIIKNEYFDRMENKKTLGVFKKEDIIESPMFELQYILRKCNKIYYNQCHLDKLKYHLIDARYNLYGEDILSLYNRVLENIYNEKNISSDHGLISIKKGEIYAKDNIFELFIYISGFGEEYKDIYNKYISFLSVSENQTRLQNHWKEG